MRIAVPFLQAGAMLALGLCALAAPAQSQSQSGSVPQKGDFNADDPDRQEAIRLYHEHKLPQAAELLEKVVARYPKDMVAHDALGVSLYSRASTQTDPARRKADRLRARAELLKAKELGDNSDLCNVLLSGIPEDGSEAPFSGNKEVEAAMQRGEAAFARADWDEAIKAYSRALELDPSFYLAAVNIGDTYFRTREWDKAGEWFAKAVHIDPNQEVAYRYWADALMAQGKMKEAREKFIQGLVAYPYASTSWAGLNSWLSRNHLAYKKIPIQLPEGPKTGPKGETIITLNPADVDASAAWLPYSLERSLWKNEKFAKEYPDEKTYRHSLKEEASALSLVAQVFTELQQDKKKKPETPDPGLVWLAQFQSEEMLEPFILLVKPDHDIARDYFAYQAAHRDKLIQFVDKYIVPPAP